MHRLLIPLLSCLFLGAPALLRAQTLHEIKYLPFDPKHIKQTPPGAEAPCGSAGTYTFGQLIGSSNDPAPSPIFLCFGDSLLVQHNGDADLSGDPQASTTPGIAYAFYTCPPTITGPTLQDVAQIPGPGDPCVQPGSATGLYITQAVPNGGATWFFNSGTLQNAFNMGQPISMFFAPITVDDFANNNFESAQVGFPPGPCIAVNTAAAFEVVYLNEITATGINNNFGNDCLGRFTVRGGYPQYDGNAIYDIDIFLTSDPTVKAIVHTPASALFHLSSVAFSVPQPGNYTVVINDGKSCPAMLTIDMNVCDASDNVTLSFPDTIVPPGGTICVPVTVQNFAILSGSFSITWDESVLQYNGLQNVSSVIDSVFSPGANLNEQQTSLGFLGVQVFNNLNPTTIFIPDDSTLFEICFTAVGTLGDCTGISVINTPTGIALEDEMGENLALSVDTGQVCVAFLPLSFTFTVTDTTCLGEALLTIVPTGGVEPYDIIVNENAPTGPTYSGTVLTPGDSFEVQNVGNPNNTPVTYDICVIDNNGAGATQCTSFVVNISRLGAQINFAQEPLCNGQSNGIISAVVLQGGIIVNNPGTNYTYAWAPAALTVQNSQVQNGVPAGLYTVTVTDINTGCSEVASGFLGQPAPISSQSIVTQPASCSGVCDGIITYEAEGGVPFAGPAYQYAWEFLDNNTPLDTGTDNPIVLGGACAGNYSITITDSRGCTATEEITLANLRSLGINQTSIQNILCFGGNSGSIGITVTESVATGNAFTFNWSPTGGTVGGTSPISSYSNLTAGTYIVSAADNLGCEVSDTITLTQPTQLRVDSLGQSNPICAQPNSGSIAINAAGGTGFGTYNFNWSPPATNVQNPSGLPFGTYTVTVTDANNCSVTRTFNLLEPTPPVVNVTVQALQCGSDGSLTASSPTGFIYVWTDINGFVIDTAQTISNLDGGDYIIRVFDTGGCEAEDTISLASITPLSFSDTTLTQPTCFGFANGTIAIGVQGGQPPYTSYNWAPQPLPNSSVIFNLAAGTYTVTVTDNASCTLVGTFLLDQPPAIVNTFSATANARVSCFGICDGEATPIVQYNSTPASAGNFTFMWSDGSTDSLRTTLCAGLNFVTITDNNCFVVDTIDITTPPQISGTVTTTDALCFGAPTGTASVTPTGGNGGPYTFVWNTGATTSNITGLLAGPYTTTITDRDGCTNAVSNIIVGQPGEIGLSFSPENPNCFGGSNGQLTVNVTGGVPNFTYFWEDEMGDNVGNSQIAEMLTAGNYYVTVTDANGCTSAGNAAIIDPAPIQGEIEPIAPLSCNGDETTLNILSISGGSGGPYSFSVDFGAVLDPTFPVTIGGGWHYVTFIDVKDCTITDSVFVLEPNPILVDFDPVEIEVELGEYANLNPILSNVASVGSFSWTNPEGLVNPDTLYATAYTFNNQSFTLTVVDSAGCTGSGTVYVVVDPNRNVYIPNIFAPGHPSGLNDHFNVNVGLGVELVNFMRVYDRWGEMVYQRERFYPNNDNLSEGWDGRYNGSFVNPGVFVYVVEVKFLDGRVLLYRGDVTVIR